VKNRLGNRDFNYIQKLYVTAMAIVRITKSMEQSY